MIKNSRQTFGITKNVHQTKYKRRKPQVTKKNLFSSSLVKIYSPRETLPANKFSASLPKLIRKNEPLQKNLKRRVECNYLENLQFYREVKVNGALKFVPLEING